MEKNGTNSKYCSSYESLRNLVNSKLQSFLNETCNYLKEKLQLDEHAYIDKVNKFKQKTKDFASKELSEVMNYVLDVNDQYIHLKETMSILEEEIPVNQIHVLVTNIKFHLIHLESLIEKYADHCQ